MMEEKYEVLARVTKRDRTSLVSIICWHDGVGCIIDKEDIINHEYSNGTVGTNGKLYVKNRCQTLGRPILDRYVGEVDLSLPKNELVSLLRSLQD